jgi:predicted NBD/HSP70 family sugar kinase
MAAGASAQAAMLRAVHDRPGVTRAGIARDLEMPSGFAAETAGQLVRAQLVRELPAPPTGARGRPTTALVPHPDGPLVAAAGIAHESWTVTVAQLGGTMITTASGQHQRDQQQVLDAVTAELAAANRRFGDRIRAAAVSVPGIVVGSTLVQASNLGWHDVDLSALWPRYDRVPLAAGNDATFAAVAESRRGSGRGAGMMIYLLMDAGVGGALVAAGRAVTGATGAAGEFGHMPFGDPAIRCECGASGCWNTSLGGRALARALGEAAPADEVSYVRNIMRAARQGSPQEIAVIDVAAAAFGRGAAGLVNAFDPHVVIAGGLGRELLAVAGERAAAAYRDGLMTFRRPVPPLAAAQLGQEAPLRGAAEQAFAEVLTDYGLQAWAARSHGR